MQAGGAFLALWNDIRAGREPEYERWHTIEHVRERVAVNGMLGARRYADARRPSHRYFTLYEASGPAVFDGAEYRDLVAHPTPWSAAMRPDFTHVVRAVCRVAASEGSGIGGHLVVLCHAMHDAAADVLREALALPGVVACHAGEGEASAPAWAGAGTTMRAFDRILLVEALDAPSADAVLRTLAPRVGLAGCVGDFGATAYPLAYVFPGHDAGCRERFRRAAWDAPRGDAADS